MIEDIDGDLYLVQVGSMYDSWNFGFLLEPLSKLLSLGVFAGFLVSRNWSGPDPTPTDVRYGFTLLVFVLALPYLLMVPTVMSTELWSLYAVIGLPVITWIVILAEHLREI